MNGRFFLRDPDGWGIVWPPGDVWVPDGMMLRGRRISRYLVRGETVFVDLELESGMTVTLRVDPPLPGDWGGRLTLRGGDFPASGDAGWIRPTPGCPYGRFSILRSFGLLGLLGAFAADRYAR